MSAVSARPAAPDSAAPDSAPSTLRQSYERELIARGYQADAAQLAALGQLQALREQLLRLPHAGAPAHPLGRWLQRLGGRWRRARRAAERTAAAPGAPAAPRGVYLWGAVGRGKTWLMDLFSDSLPGRAQRLHFHHFMRDVHAALRRLRDRSEPLQEVARQLAARAPVLCLDELYVSDIADAMILGGLFEALLGMGVTLVITANVPPRLLYQDGLQRARFLPAIALLERELQVLCVDGGIDYRLRQLQRRPLYLSSLDAHTAARMQALFEQLAGAHGDTATELQVQGRRLRALQRRGAVVWFGFAALCEGPRSQNDYVELAQEFHTVLLSDVPVFSQPAQDNAARRFIALVDEFYDQGVKLVLSAAAAPAELYRGGRLRAEFHRTHSRLVEMQSEAYLARAHGRAPPQVPG
ncbi:MAG TPA: cell division protein ZapE [Steroidobacteraceae bacterium]|nr:cell division protein ZapE [Steroidobacteraceae bacterium]